jgi:hypothetical protein
MADAIIALQLPKTTASKTVHTAKVGYHGVAVELGRSHHDEGQQTQVLLDLNSVVAALMEVAQSRNNENAVVVIDEFDRIVNDVERVHFADFIKQVGDRRIPVRFVFCGVSESMQKLLGAHGSCYRYLDGIELRGLGYDARFEIIDAGPRV